MAVVPEIVDYVRSQEGRLRVSFSMAATDFIPELVQFHNAKHVEVSEILARIIPRPSVITIAKLLEALLAYVTDDDTLANARVVWDCAARYVGRRSIGTNFVPNDVQERLITFCPEGVPLSRQMTEAVLEVLTPDWLRA